MPNFPSFRVDYALLCDDARREDNGKWMYIGVYPVDVVPFQIPTTLVLRLVFRLAPLKMGTVKIEGRATLDGAIVGSFGGTMEVGTLTPDNFVTPALPVTLPHYGNLEFQLREDTDGEWKSILELPVHSQEAANSSTTTP